MRNSAQLRIRNYISEQNNLEELSILFNLTIVKPFAMITSTDSTDLSEFDFYQISGVETKALQKPAPSVREGNYHTLQSAYSAIFNWESMRYESISSSVKNTLGYNMFLFRKLGLNFVLSIIHPQDRKCLKRLHEKIFEVFYQTSLSLRSEIRFSYNLRLISAFGDYRHIVRQSRFVQLSNEGKPRLEFIESNDVTDHLPFHSIRLIIKVPQNDGLGLKVLEFHFGDLSVNLSDRELQVLQLIARGFTSRDISAMLFLSTETVKSHRKNILLKTRACNIAEAVGIVYGGGAPG